MKRSALILTGFLALAFAAPAMSAPTTGNTALDDCIALGESGAPLFLANYDNDYIACLWDDAATPDDDSDDYWYDFHPAETIPNATCESLIPVVQQGIASQWGSTWETGTHLGCVGVTTIDGKPFFALATLDSIIDDNTGAVRAAVTTGGAWTAFNDGLFDVASPVLIPAAQYASDLLSFLVSILVDVLPYAGAVAAFAIGVAMIRRWLGRRKATEV